MILLNITFIIACLVFLLLHLRTRRKGYINICDYFVTLILILYGPLILFFSSGSGTYRVSPETAERTVLALTIMYLCLSLGFILQRDLRLKKHRYDNILYLSGITYIILCVISIIMSISYILTPSVRSYVFDIYDLYMKQLGNEVYAYIRRTAYSGDLMISSVMSRTRYSFSAFLFGTIFSLILFKKYNKLIGFVVLAVLFMCTVVSLSKLTWATYFFYIILIIHYYKLFVTEKKLNRINLLIIIVISPMLIVAILDILYIVQYEQWILSDFFGDPLNLTVYRLYGIFYNGIVRYFEIYPNILPFTKGYSIGLISTIFSGEHRNLGKEVAGIWLGIETTTNPAMFVAGAWADFGYLGVIIYSIFVGWLIKYFDEFVIKIRFMEFRTAFIAICAVNSMMLLQVSLTVALITHGLAIFPLLFSLVDYIAAQRNPPKKEKIVR